MRHRKHLHLILCSICLVLLWSTLATAQLVRPRKPTEPVVKSSQPEPPLRSKPTPESINNMDAQGIREVNVTPSEKNVVITFRARPSLVAVAEISRERPAQGQEGKLEFSNRLSKTNASTIPNKYEISPTGYTASFSGLETGTVYYYLITATSSDGTSIRQTQGRFRTVKYKTNVTVVFTEIKVTNDSDDGGNGELFFDFYINGAKVSFWGYVGMTLSWNDDEPGRALTPAVTTEIVEAADVLELAVNGFDDDGPLGVKTGLDSTGPLTAPFEDTWYEGNVAKQTFSLKDYPGEDHREDFNLLSMRQSAGQGDLAFNVKGYFVIKREKMLP